MTIEYMESFDVAGSLAELRAKAGGTVEGTLLTTAGINGGGALALGTSNGTVLSSLLPTTPTYVSVAFWNKQLTTLPSSNALVQIGSTTTLPTSQISNGSTHLGFIFITGGILQCYMGGALVDTITPAQHNITTDVWQHIEMRLYIDAVGVAELYVDGILVYSFAGDTADASSLAYNFCIAGTGTSTNRYVDDVVVIAAPSALPAVIGQHVIQAQVPTGAGTNSAWTGAYTDVDDPFLTVSDGDTTYITSTTLNAKSDFAIAALAITPTTILGIQTSVETRKTDAGTKGVTPYIISNVTTSAGVEVPATEAYLYASTIYNTDPDTAAAWTEAGVNAIKVGVEITT